MLRKGKTVVCVAGYLMLATTLHGEALKEDEEISKVRRRFEFDKWEQTRPVYGKTVSTNWTLNLAATNSCFPAWTNCAIVSSVAAEGAGIVRYDQRMVWSGSGHDTSVYLTIWRADSARDAQWVMMKSLECTTLRPGDERTHLGLGDRSFLSKKGRLVKDALFLRNNVLVGIAVVARTDSDSEQINEQRIALEIDKQILAATK